MRSRVLFAIVATAFVLTGCASSDGQPAPEATAREEASALRIIPAPSPTAGCQTDDDCRLFDDYCGGCDCRALGKTQATPSCKGKTIVACFVQPCRALSAVCLEGKCAASSGAL
jgi:hypothetical protein